MMDRVLSMILCTALFLIVPAADLRSQASAAPAPETVKVFGRVTDFDGRPIEGASVELKNSRFDNVAQTLSDKDGRYSLAAPKGIYMALTAVKDYRVRSLEYWAWSVPAEKDLEIDPRFDRLEVYGLNAWSVQGGSPSLMIYFRPMSLIRTGRAIAGAGGMEKLGELAVLDIAPDLEPGDIQVSIDGRPVKVLQASRVREASGTSQYLFGYVVQVPWPDPKPVAEVFPVTVTIVDRATGEKGEGCLFYRPARVI